MPSSSKMDLTTIVIVGNFNCLFNGKSSSQSNLIFMKSSLVLPLFMVFYHYLWFLIPSQNSLYFFSTCSFLSAECNSIESKTKYLRPFFPQCTICANHQTERIYTMNIFIIINLFNCDLSNVVNTNTFVRLFVYF